VTSSLHAGSSVVAPHSPMVAWPPGGSPSSVMAAPRPGGSGLPGATVIDGGPNDTRRAPNTGLSAEDSTSVHPEYPQSCGVPSVATSGSCTTTPALNDPPTTGTGVEGPHSPATVAGSGESA
jgi:hypothetical protein